MIPTIEDAIAFAAKKHRGQVDKAGEPYILHPLRVMLAMDTDEARRVAVLHDVMEDCGVSRADLEQLGYPPAEIAAVEALTKRPDMDTRLKQRTRDDATRLARYEHAKRRLMTVAMP